EAMVLPASALDGVLLEKAHAGDGLARIENRAAGAVDRVDEPARERGDARQVLHEVERRALGLEDAAGIADHLRARRPRLDLRAVGHELPEPERGIGFAEREPRD